MGGDGNILFHLLEFGVITQSRILRIRESQLNQDIHCYQRQHNANTMLQNLRKNP